MSRKRKNRDWDAPSTWPKCDAESHLIKICSNLDGNVTVANDITQSMGGGISGDDIATTVPLSLVIYCNPGNSEHSEDQWTILQKRLEAVSILCAVAGAGLTVGNATNPPPNYFQCSDDLTRRKSSVPLWIHFLAEHCHLKRQLIQSFCRDDYYRRPPIITLLFSNMKVTPGLMTLCSHLLTARRNVRGVTRLRYQKAMEYFEERFFMRNKLDPVLIKLSFKFFQSNLQDCSPPTIVMDDSGSTTCEQKGKDHPLIRRETDDTNPFKAFRDAVEAVANHTTRVCTSLQSHRKAKGPLVGGSWPHLFYEVWQVHLDRPGISSTDLLHLESLLKNHALRLDCVTMKNTLSEADALTYQIPFAALLYSAFNQPNQSKTKKLELDGNVLSYGSMASIFSAIYYSYSPSVRELSLHGTCNRCRADVGLSWKWLAFALFHPQSTSKVAHLDLSYNRLTRQDVNAMTSVVGMISPTKSLLPSKVANMDGIVFQSSERKEVLLLEGTTLYASLPQSSKAKRLQHVQKLALPESYWCEQVCCHGSKWILVLIAGYGPLWTSSVSVCQTKPKVFDLESQPVPLKSLHLSSMIDPESWTPRRLRRFLRLVGNKLEALDVHDNSFTQDCLSTIVNSCPSLRWLNISGCDITSIAPLLDAMERGSFCPTRLDLSCNQIFRKDILRLCILLYEVEPRASSKFVYQNILARVPTGNPRAQTLCSLDLSGNSIERRGLEAIGRMLENNNTIHTLRLDAPQESDKYFQERSYMLEYEIRSFGLQTEHKVALMSVFHKKRGWPAELVKLIADFAGARAMRRVVWQ